MGRKAVDMTGQYHSPWTVLKRVEGSSPDSGFAMWLCRCDCGHHMVLSRGTLVRKGQSPRKRGCRHHFAKVLGEDYGEDKTPV